MALLSYVENDTDDEEARVFFGHVEGLMGRVANALRVAAQVPEIAQPLVGFMIPAIRTEITNNVPVRIKTLVILKTSFINGCNYCIGHNSSLGRSLGFSEEEIEAIDGDFRNSDFFSPAEKAAIAWAEYLTERTYRQHPEAMPELKAHFTEPQIVEITMVSGFFNFWNRFVDSLQIDLEPEKMVGNIKKSKVIDPQDYLAFMRDCWWRESDKKAEAAE
jgi:AhpD family alkylhydroperoxidase